MLIGVKIKLLSADMGWSQTELAIKINADQAQISGYERGEALASIGVIKRLANIFNVTTDYLLFEEKYQKASLIIKSNKLLELFNQIEEIDPMDKKTLPEMMKIIVIKNRMQAVAKAS